MVEEFLLVFVVGSVDGEGAPPLGILWVGMAWVAVMVVEDSLASSSSRSDFGLIILNE